MRLTKSIVAVLVVSVYFCLYSYGAVLSVTSKIERTTVGSKTESTPAKTAAEVRKADGLIKDVVSVWETAVH